MQFGGGTPVGKGAASSHTVVVAVGLCLLAVIVTIVDLSNLRGRMIRGSIVANNSANYTTQSAGNDDNGNHQQPYTQGDTPANLPPKPPRRPGLLIVFCIYLLVFSVDCGVRIDV